MAFKSFETIEQLAKFEPARTYLWDLTFDFRPFKMAANASLGAKLPVNDVVAFCPAESMNWVLANISSGDLTNGQTSYRFPAGTTAKEITINFIDDYQNSIRDWIVSWMNDIILCKGKCVNYLEHVYDILTVYDMDATKLNKKPTHLNVYPDGPIAVQYTSDSGIQVFSVNFVVIGRGSI